MSSLPTFNDADRCFHYDAVSGVLIWKATAPQPKRAGTVAGTTDARGYVSVHLNGKSYRAHRVMWLLRYGVWPPAEIDHANGDPGDNRLCNLRLATGSQNKMNRRRHSRNAAGIKGVSWSRGAGRWIAQIMADGKRYHLGYYTTAAAAGRAYADAASRLHGDFARFDARPLDAQRQISA